MKWIRLKDRAPRHREAVLWFLYGDRFDVGVWSDGLVVCDGTTYSSPDIDEDFYWMPLPQPPKDE